jgi:hypothetical protein
MTGTVASRADRHNNPAAFTTDIARQAGLAEGTDYVQGEPFGTGPAIEYTARLIGDPVALTIKVIDAIGYRTRTGEPRWTYTCLPKTLWMALPQDDPVGAGWSKLDQVGYHYQNEGGTQMRGLFPKYGQP